MMKASISTECQPLDYATLNTSDAQKGCVNILSKVVDVTPTGFCVGIHKFYRDNTPTGLKR